MHVRTIVCASVMAIGMAGTITTVSAADQETSKKNASTVAKQAASASAAPSRPFATLRGVKAVKMEAQELKSVKGMHIHFWTGGAPIGEPHLVNQLQNNLGNGQAPAGSGPGYSGLCVANVQSPSIFINPGGGC
jgi:hypothetical protein